MQAPMRVLAMMWVGLMALLFRVIFKVLERRSKLKYVNPHLEGLEVGQAIIMKDLHSTQVYRIDKIVEYPEDTFKTDHVICLNLNTGEEIIFTDRELSTNRIG